jgi:hypothetical protein
MIAIASGPALMKKAPGIAPGLLKIGYRADQLNFRNEDTRLHTFSDLVALGKLAKKPQSLGLGLQSS